MVLFGSPGIPNCNALRCICWVLVFASIFLTATIHWLVRGLSCEPNKQLYALYRFRNWERGWGVRRKIYQSPKKLVTDRLKAVVLFGVRVSVTFHLVCLLYFSSVLLSQCHLFGKSCFYKCSLVFCSYIKKTRPCNEYPRTPHFYIAKLGFTRVYIYFSYFCSKT